MEFMENPLELIAGAGGEDDPEVVLARDSNAVPRVYHSDWPMLAKNRRHAALWACGRQRR